MAPSPSFEESMARLEELCGELEEGDLSLDESLRRYEEGVGALRRCESFLKKAEQKVRVLLEKQDGELEEEPFGEAEPPAAAQKEIPAAEEEEAVDDDDDDDDMPF